MAQPSVEKIADIVLDRRRVYGLEIDSQIRKAANHMTARALFELLGEIDDEAPDFSDRLSHLLKVFPQRELMGLIGFATGKPPTRDPDGGSDSSLEHPTEFYLRLVFADEDAAYYQFPLFPDLDAEYVLGAARKRTGAVQHLRIMLSSPEALQTFIDACRTNPHFLRLEESTAEEFDRAPSNAV